MRVVLLIFGIIAMLLGALWLLQGSGVVSIRPILCFAECEAVQGPSVQWVIMGGVIFALGTLAVRRGMKRS